jgi:hypothetical protein
LAEKSEQNAGQEEFDATQDRYPSLDEVLSAIQAQEDLAEAQVERLEVNLQPSGEATWRVWEPRAEEPTGGYIPAQGQP